MSNNETAAVALPRLQLPPSKRVCIRDTCPCCARRSVILSWWTKGMGWDSTCLRCGDSFGSGTRAPRMFTRTWREEAATAARHKWRNGGTAMQWAMRPKPCPDCRGTTEIHESTCGIYARAFPAKTGDGT